MSWEGLMLFYCFSLDGMSTYENSLNGKGFNMVRKCFLFCFKDSLTSYDLIKVLIVRLLNQSIPNRKKVDSKAKNHYLQFLNVNYCKEWMRNAFERCWRQKPCRHLFIKVWSISCWLSCGCQVYIETICHLCHYRIL